MTKEPKLEAAVRIVPEWQDYDQEIKQLQMRFQREKEAGALGPGKVMEVPHRDSPRRDGKGTWALGERPSSHQQ